MNKRLLAIAKNVHNGKGLIDVGTDHGYLPVYLAQNGYTGDLFASDINKGPLQSAVRSAQEAGLEKRINFLLCDGLDKCDSALIDTVVIAGMGGDVISGILDKADWLLSGDYELILQPMTKSEVLRYWLINNGFTIRDEQLVEDSGHIYQILVSRGGKAPAYSEAELFLGKYETIRKEPLFPIKLLKLTESFEKNLAGLSSSDKPVFEARRKLTAAICSQLLELHKKYTEDQ